MGPVLGLAAGGVGWAAPMAGGGGWGLPVTFLEEPGQGWVARGGTLRAGLDVDGLRLWSGGQGLAVRYAGRSEGARVEGGAAAGGAVNLLVGRDAEGWRTGLRAYESVWVRGLYAGIDLQVSGAAGGRLKSEYVVAAGADPGRIRLRYEPAERVTVEPDGSLRIETGAGVWREAAPVLYQERGGRAVAVDGRYAVLGDGTVGFEVGTYDRGRPLVIDPVVTFSSLLGGAGSSAATGVAVDAAGYVYVAGYADSGDLPVVGAASPRVGGVDAYVAKIQASTGRLIYATYIGGSGDDRAFAVAVDGTGAAYVTGWTTSANFPVTSAAQGSISGYKDAFLLKLNPAGNGFSFSTFYGGKGSDAGNALALTATQVWVGGETDSAVLPGPNGWRNSNGGGLDGFVARFSQSGVPQVSTMAGGGGEDSVKALAVDASGNIVAGGATGSSNMGFPMGGAQTALKGAQDGFVVKFDSTGVQMVAGTYLGGTRGDVANPEMVLGLAVDGAQNVYVTGSTTSSDFPLVSALDGLMGGMQDAFVARLTAGLNSITWSTLLGGAGKETATAIALDATGAVVVGGSTTSSDFPVQGGTQSTAGGGYEGFVTRLPATGASLLFSTYVGGSGQDGVAALVLGAGGTIHAAGQSGSGDFAQKNAVQTAAGGGLRMMVARVAVGVLPSLQSVSPNAGSGAAQTFTFSAVHPSGAAQITGLELMVAPAAGSATVCRMRWERASGLLGLAADSGLTWSTVAVGSGSAVGNSQCTLTGIGASVVSSGNTVTVTARLSFGSSFAGTRNLYLNATAASGEETGFAAAGTFTVAAVSNQTPAAGAVSPSSGSGASGRFSVVFSDTNGGADITVARVIVGASPVDGGTCSVRVHPATGVVELAADGGATWSGGTAGSSGVLQNSQCQVKLASTGVSVSDSTVTVVLDVTFLQAFSGSRGIYGQATDTGGSTGAWRQLGSWTVPAPSAPVATLVSPSSDGGSAQVFTFYYSDTNGAADIAVARVLINASQTAAGGCYFAVERATGSVWLADDSGNVWAAQAHLGTAETASNGQCTVVGAGSAWSDSGTLATLTVSLKFTAAFNGAKNVYANATDAGGWTSTSPRLGSYSVAVTGGAPTGPVSVVPASGSGAAQVFSFTFTDPRGATDLTWLRVLVHGQQTAVGGCYIEVDPVGLVAYLYDDSGSAYTMARLGTNDTAQNSQCAVSGAESSVTLSGTTATLVLALSFQAAFAGDRNVWANASDRTGFTSGSPLLGTYSVALPAGQALGPVSVAPAAGSGASQSFTFLFADPKGASDLAWMRVLIHSQQTAAGGCYVAVERATSVVYLANDAGTSWVTARMGTADVAQNSQCSVSGASSSMALSGTSATVVLGVTFQAAFNGTKTIWANATDGSGATSGSPPVGSYTVAAVGGNQAPVPVLAAPTGGSGSRQLFTFTYTDPNGGGDIEMPRVLIHSQQVADHGCYLQVTRSTGVLALADDAGANWLTAHLGANETAQNGQCVLYGATSSAVVVGNTLVLNVDVGFQGSFTGAKNIWMNATDAGGLTSDSPLMGVFSVTP